MKIERLSADEGQAIAKRLEDVRALEGTYYLVPRAEDTGRFFIVPADGDKGDYHAMTGRDPARGWVTLLQNRSHAILMLGATQAPLD